MFGMGWWELSIVGLILVLVLGPKELPYAMRTIARFMRKARRLAGEFQGHMDEIVREADLDEVRKTVTSIQNKDVGSIIEKAVDPTGDLTRDIDSTLADARKEVQDIKTAAGPSPAAPGKSTPPQIAPKPESAPSSAAETTKVGPPNQTTEPSVPTQAKVETATPKSEPVNATTEPAQDAHAAAGNA